MATIQFKGEQLLGSVDTQYKSDVFERMNAMKGKLEQVRVKTTTVKMNDKFEFELVPSGQEEIKIRTRLDGK